MTSNEQWMKLYQPITQRRRLAIGHAQANIGLYKEHDRLLLDAMLAVIRWHYQKKKTIFVAERQAVTDARKRGEDPLIWKLSRSG